MVTDDDISKIEQDLGRLKTPEEIWAEALPVLRKRIGITQSDLAGFLHVTRQTIHLYESKKKSIPYQTIIILSVAFLCDPLTCDFLKPMQIDIHNKKFKQLKGKISVQQFFKEINEDVKGTGLLT